LQILIIEDDKKIAKAVAEGLTADHYSVTVCLTGEEGFFELGRTTFDLVILDVMLPGCSGFDVLETMRKRGDGTPVLMLTAKDAVSDRVKGLNIGADDYLVKPFSFSELLARVQALLRRGKSAVNLHLRIADLEIDLLTRKVTRAGDDVELTAKEYELLEYMLRRPKQIISREQLAKDVWKETARVTSLDNVIDVHIARLRKKIDGGDEPKLIHTIRGAGFMLAEQP
jgi:two-component system, OmpR family, copper resistance phosphate regulon response regulator CusR